MKVRHSCRGWERRDSDYCEQARGLLNGIGSSAEDHWEFSCSSNNLIVQAFSLTMLNILAVEEWSTDFGCDVVLEL